MRQTKLEKEIANITVHTALNTPHSWVNIPRVLLFDEKGMCAVQDVRICKLCNRGERLIGRGDKLWKELGPVDVMTILEKYDRYQKGI